MRKKSSQSFSMKISKHEKKQPLNSLIKILRPKVYITDSSNFKKLVQELTGNGTYSPVDSSPPRPPSTSVSLSPPTWEDQVPFAQTDHHHHHHDHHLAHQENSSVDVSFDSSCFTTPLEGSPDLCLRESLNCELGNSLERQKMDFYKDLEAMLMEMDSGTNCDYDDACYGMFQQDQVCVYDYDLSNFM